MNDNEPKKGAVNKFIAKHKTNLTIGACVFAAATVYVGICCAYDNGRTNQYIRDAKGFAKQFDRAIKVLDDDTKNAFIDAFNAAGSTYQIE